MAFQLCLPYKYRKNENIVSSSTSTMSFKRFTVLFTIALCWDKALGQEDKTFSQEGKLCPNSDPITINLEPILGRWYITEYADIGTPFKTPTCGLYTTDKPCKCIQFTFEASLPSIFFASLDYTEYGYNTTSKEYESLSYREKLISLTRMIFASQYSEDRVFIVNLLARDTTWAAFTKCFEDGFHKHFIVTREQNPSEEIIEQARAGFMSRYTGPSFEWQRIDQTDCPELEGNQN